ncbi:hypothetical protein, partial [Mesorhizobium sp. M1D.F.Ca.ET.183.01.1.1]|uniref:hypothetical protein n=1 Tax=Mesorhizobium sp. M1D.F.Ca.ET.183.01.1.1 TaxID=2496666 RepID=UPI001AED93DE
RDRCKQHAEGKNDEDHGFKHGHRCPRREFSAQSRPGGLTIDEDEWSNPLRLIKKGRQRRPFFAEYTRQRLRVFDLVSDKLELVVQGIAERAGA